jgi:hypothetical protein
VIVGIVSILLFSWQILSIKKTVQRIKIIPRSTIEEKSVTGITEKREDINNDFETAKENISNGIEFDEEDLINNLKEEGLLEEEDVENLLGEKEINKEDLKEGDLLKIIIEEDLIKEKNEGEKE